MGVGVMATNRPGLGPLRASRPAEKHNNTKNMSQLWASMCLVQDCLRPH